MERLGERNIQDLARCITAAENNTEPFAEAFAPIRATLPKVPVLGITGTGGAGKSSMVDELVRRFLMDFPDKRIALVSVDPSKRKTGGALLGDRHAQRRRACGRLVRLLALLRSRARSQA